MQKVTAPNAPISHGPLVTDHFPEDRMYWVRGVLYTDNPAWLAYFRRRGHQVEDAPDGVPADHLATITAMRAIEKDTGVGPSVGTLDAANPTMPRHYSNA